MEGRQLSTDITWKTRLCNTFAPLCSTARDNKVIASKIRGLVRCDDCCKEEALGVLSEFGDLVAVGDAGELEQLLAETTSQKERLEEKAKVLVVALTIATSLIMGFLNVLTNLYSAVPVLWGRILLALVSIFSVGYMVASGLCAIKVLTDEIEVYQPGGDAEEPLAECRQCIAANRLGNLRRNNLLYTSYDCLRRALIGIFAVFSSMVMVA